VLGGIDRRVIAFLFSIIEPPDCPWNFTGIRKETMIEQPDTRKITLELFNFIRETFGCNVMKIRW
jgi:hypothetical protein